MSTPSARSAYLMRAGLVRNVRTAEHLTTFVVSGVSTVLITRLILGLSGYPQIGGKGLHIAHVLPGGLLMLVAIFLLLAYVGPVVRPAAALVGGVGFGLFIDEVGKFIPSDNNYFYQPTAAIVYVVFVLIVLATRFVTNRRPIDPKEQLANVVDHAVEGVSGGLSVRRSAQATEQLELVDRSVPGWPEAQALLLACPPDEVELAAPVDAAWRALQRGFERLATHPYTPRGRCRSTGGAGDRCTGYRGRDPGRRRAAGDGLPSSRGGCRELAVGNLHAARLAAVAAWGPGARSTAVRACCAGVATGDPGVPVRRHSVRSSRRDDSRPRPAGIARRRTYPASAGVDYSG